ncbi:MAG: IS1 family transposase [Paludibacteraceae bacterium]|nr:IS1 family transposase [Paludibacteraceae bacterium]
MKIKKSDMNIIHIINNAEAIWLRFRWKNGIPVCPYCERKTKQYLCKNNRYKCNHCNRKYSSRVKTIVKIRNYRQPKFSVQSLSF